MHLTHPIPFQRMTEDARRVLYFAQSNQTSLRVVLHSSLTERACLGSMM